MGVKSWGAKVVAKAILKDLREWSRRPFETQEKVFHHLLRQGRQTAFGQDHHFDQIRTYREFQERVPIRSYEELLPWLERVVRGKENILWPGKPLYLAKTSGTTAGAKFIPISRESMPGHIDTARNALLSYVERTGNARFFDGKMMFLSGSPELHEQSGIKTGRLSGIVNHHVPSILQGNRMPSEAVNRIEDWEAKVERIVDETVGQDMRLISGIPPWVQMYFDRVEARTGKKVGKVFPNFSVFVHGGVNFEPYRAKLFRSIGREVDTIETYPASEGFIAFQDQKEEDGLLLVLNKGIFYEFVPAHQWGQPDAPRLRLQDVELGVNYGVILSTTAGLWAYNIGDTVKFVSKNPFRLVVTGRLKHKMDAFGEHVIGEEVDSAMAQATAELGIEVSEFHVAPQVAPAEGLPYHEWFIELQNGHEKLPELAQRLDELMQQQNPYYRDNRQGKVLRQLLISPVQENGFLDYMRSLGKLGGQSKYTRLANDRSVADRLEWWVISS